MKVFPAEIFPVNKPLRVQLMFYHVLLLLICLPFDRMYSHIILISFCLQLVLPAATNGRIKTIPWKKILLPAAVFFCTGFSLLYSSQPGEGGKEWLLQLPLLLMPLILYLVSEDLKYYRDNMLMAFSMMSCLTVIYLFGNAIWTIRHFSLPAASLFSAAFTNHNFSEPVKMHATYLSMQWMLALVFFARQGWRAKNRRWRATCFLAALVLLTGLLQLCSKSAGAALGCTVLFAWPLILKNDSHRRRAIVLSLTFAAVVAAVIIKSSVFRQRYLTELRSDFSQPEAGELAEPRVARWITAWEISRSAPLLGHGAGTEKQLLHDAFYRKKYYNSFLNHLNAHSQYLSLLLKNGVIGFTTYVIILGLGFRSALRRRDPLFITFMLLTTLASFGENILDVDKGVYFYAVFFSFFLFFPESREQAQPAHSFYRSYRKARRPVKPATTIAIAGNNQ